ncbi:cytochrome c oxidase assembly protein [Bacillus salipaludis]|uniref:cytochrome c oxidase assembly protein n=1 Tax=Bacillus salipaludis TaxID=2547811 RepID=UPI002E1B52B4|nr:cytochrome c oxidase assembly protein [Bacillus salipaludis]
MHWSNPEIESRLPFLEVPLLLLILSLTLGLFFYIVFIGYKQRYLSYPLYRSICLVLGICCIIAASIGPLASLAHMDFTAHMLVHLLLGMLAPLLVVLASPLTLLLRTLKVEAARSLTKILRLKLFSILSNPIIASILNIGGLWILYTSTLYSAMRHNILLHMLVHIHVFLAGYLFTAAIIYMDPTPHRKSYFYRAMVLVITIAGHDILAKYLYAHPPANVPVRQAETGSMLMYYGGDIIDLLLITIFCFQWFKAARPRININTDFY